MDLRGHFPSIIEITKISPATSASHVRSNPYVQASATATSTAKPLQMTPRSLIEQPALEFVEHVDVRVEHVPSQRKDDAASVAARVEVLGAARRCCLCTKRAAIALRMVIA
jgi:hypothetical protein